MALALSLLRSLNTLTRQRRIFKTLGFQLRLNVQ
jgi:hypothetical protein